MNPVNKVAPADRIKGIKKIILLSLLLLSARDNVLAQQDSSAMLTYSTDYKTLSDSLYRYIIDNAAALGPGKVELVESLLTVDMRGRIKNVAIFCTTDTSLANTVIGAIKTTDGKWKNKGPADQFVRIPFHFSFRDDASINTAWDALQIRNFVKSNESKVLNLAPVVINVVDDIHDKRQPLK